MPWEPMRRLMVAKDGLSQTLGPAARIRVTFEKAGADWKLTVADNGGGRQQPEEPSDSAGLGTALIAALAKQLDAVVSETSTKKGLTVEVTRASFVSRIPHAA